LEEAIRSASKVYRMDKMPTVRSRLTVPRLSHEYEGRGDEDLFNTSTNNPAHFNNNATTLTTMKSSKYDNDLLLGAIIWIKHGKFAGKAGKIVECVTYLPPSSNNDSTTTKTITTTTPTSV